MLHLEVDSYLGNELKVMNTRLEARGRVQSKCEGEGGVGVVYFLLNDHM